MDSWLNRSIAAATAVFASPAPEPLSTPLGRTHHSGQPHRGGDPAKLADALVRLAALHNYHAQTDRQSEAARRASGSSS